jgi:sodium/proline symporter
MLVVVIFTMQGGLLAVAITDTIMCVGMVIASIIVYVTITKDIPVLDLITAVGNLKTEFANPTTSAPYGSGKNTVFLVFIYALLFTTTLPYMSVRFLSFKDDIKLHKMAVIMAPIGVVLSLIPLTGIYMYYKNPNLVNPDSAMPVFLNTFLPPALGGMITLFILFAMLSTISSVLQALASSLSYDMYKSVANKNSAHGDLFNRVGVLITAVWALFLTFAAPQGMLNQIAYIGTGGLISAFVGPTIMRVFVEADLRACLSSMLVGFVINVLLVFKLAVGWVEAPILAGLAGCVVYVVVGYINNGGSRKAPFIEETVGTV